MIRRISSVCAVAAAALTLAGAQAPAQEQKQAQGRQAGGVAGRAQQPPQEQRPAEPGLRERAERTADTLLERAQSAGDAALAWLRRRGAGAEEDLRDALKDAAARAKDSRRLGLSLLAAAATDPRKDAPRWEPSLPQRTPERLVLLVHGMDEPGGIWDDLAPALAAAGHAVARLDYANDQPLARSAEDLAAALRDLRARGTLRVDIVAHSAGGLISRDVLTRDADGMYRGSASGHGDLPDVARLIMFGTPNRGAALARFRALTEAREQFIRWIESDGRDPAALLGFLHDGSGEAGADLRPGSAYLDDLNTRPLPRGVAITAVVGTLADTEGDTLAATLRWPLVRRVLSDEEIREAEAAIQRLKHAAGDGAVSTTSQRLEGAEIVELEANHRSMLRRFALPALGGAGGPTNDSPPPPGVGVVLERVGK